MFPLLYAYICDHLEGCKIIASYDTNKCQMPCSLCLCLKDLLKEVNHKCFNKTKQEMQIIVETIFTSWKKDGEEMSKKFLIHPIKVRFHLHNLTYGKILFTNCITFVFKECFELSLNFNLFSMMLMCIVGVLMVGKQNGKIHSMWYFLWTCCIDLVWE